MIEIISQILIGVFVFVVTFYAWSHDLGDEYVTSKKKKKEKKK